MPVKIEIFTTPTCPNCNPTIEFVKRVVEELEDEVEIETIDINKHPSRALSYGIFAVPTVAINGIVKFIGMPNKESLLDAIKFCKW